MIYNLFQKTTHPSPGRGGGKLLEGEVHDALDAWRAADDCKSPRLRKRKRPYEY